MNNFNKKGDSGFSWVKGAFVLLLTIAIVLILYFMTRDATDSIDAFMVNSDYDGDGSKDFMDVCPCGSDNNKQEVNGKSWCVASLTEDQCGCANSFANSALKAVLKNKYKQDTFFMWTGGKCLYMKDDGCKYLIHADENKVENTEKINGNACTQLP